jgi:hypothetical protein
LQLAIRGDEELDTLIKVRCSLGCMPVDNMCRLSSRAWRGRHSAAAAVAETYCRPPSMQATIAGGGVIPHIHKSLINKVRK